jgi:hypothetical protein
MRWQDRWLFRLISLPLLMTSAVIVSGLMFESDKDPISSSEAVNWWPVSQEYVAASALSTSSLYSAFLALCRVRSAIGVSLTFESLAMTMLLSVLSLYGRVHC